MGPGIYTCVHEGASTGGQELFSYLSVTSGSGAGLVDLPNSDRYCAMMRPLLTSVQEYLCNDYQDGLSRADMPLTANILPFSQDGLTTGNICAASANWLEPRWLSICPLPNSGTVIINRNVPLNAFRGTYCALNRDTLCNIDLFLQGFSLPGNRMYFGTTTPNTPSIAANVTVAATAVQISNLYLYLALEVNEEIQQDLYGLLKAGKTKYAIPYVVGYRMGMAAAGTTGTQTFTLARNFGKTLKRLTFSAFSGNETSNLAWCRNNSTGAMIQNYQVTLNSRPSTDFYLSCYNPLLSLASPIASNNWVVPTVAVGGSLSSDDWRTNRDVLKGSVIQNAFQYQLMWSHSEVFGQNANMLERDKAYLDDSNINDGLSLDSDVVVVATFNCPAGSTANTVVAVNGLAFYCFSQVQRELIINEQGIGFSA